MISYTRLRVEHNFIFFVSFLNDIYLEIEVHNVCIEHYPEIQGFPNYCFLEI